MVFTTSQVPPDTGDSDSPSNRNNGEHGQVTLIATIENRLGYSQQVNYDKGIAISAHKNNAGDVELGYAGMATGNGYILSPGMSVRVHVRNIQTIRLIGTADDVVSWIADEVLD